MSSPHPVDGSWLPIKAELRGESAPALALEKMEVRVSDGRYTVLFAEEIMDAGLIEWSANGESMILTGEKGPNAQRTIRAIYQVRGDRLRICYGLDGRLPPDFTTDAASDRYSVLYRRKPATS